jgi:hypothetical protein
VFRLIQVAATRVQHQFCVHRLVLHTVSVHRFILWQRPVFRHRVSARTICATFVMDVAFGMIGLSTHPEIVLIASRKWIAFKYQLSACWSFCIWYAVNFPGCYKYSLRSKTVLFLANAITVKVEARRHVAHVAEVAVYGRLSSFASNCRCLLVFYLEMFAFTALSIDQKYTLIKEYRKNYSLALVVNWFLLNVMTM